jgi:hypothetical protein
MGLKIGSCGPGWTRFAPDRVRSGRASTRRICVPRRVPGLRLTGAYELSKFLDEYHRAATVRAEPSWFGSAGFRGLRRLLGRAPG